ncbi:TipAS antibiotic-recognition domain-containing protein [Blautia obeum]|uniref:TipAS antibiotic-recognition domain-containing protein n=1 Tax=Blautia obeum TaxID=40520 RepID=UPI00321B25A3
MNFEFMTIDTPLPPCMPFPRALTGFPVSSTAKDKFLSVARTPVSKEVAESYNKRIEAILQKLIAKQNCDIDSFEVKELVGEYGFVMKQLAQIKEEKGFMMAQAQYYRNEQIKPMIDEKYGEGASDFFAQAIENYYKVK